VSNSSPDRRNPHPKKALEGFARKNGIHAPSNLVLTTTDKGSIGHPQRISRPQNHDILADALPASSGRSTSRKTMYWTGKGGARFIRPIRWLVALLADK